MRPASQGRSTNSGSGRLNDICNVSPRPIQELQGSWEPAALGRPSSLSALAGPAVCPSPSLLWEGRPLRTFPPEVSVCPVLLAHQRPTFLWHF